MLSVPRLQLRWVGHRLQGIATIQVADTTLAEAALVVHDAEHELGQALPNLDDMTIRTVTTVGVPSAPHTHDH